MPFKRWLKPLLACLLLLLLAALYWFCFRDVGAAELRDWIDRSGAAAPLCYIAAFTFLPVAFFPAQILAPVGGLLFGLWAGLLYTLIGAMLNSALMFWLARGLLHDSLGAWLERKCPAKWQDALFHSAQGGFWLIFILRLIPAVPYNVINFAAGLSGVAFRPYLLATVTGIIPGTLVYLNIGDKLTVAGSPAFWLSLALLLALTVLSLLLAKWLKPGTHPLRALPVLTEQRIMFDRRFVSCEQAEAVFWPGCSLLSLSPHIVDGLYDSLRTVEPALGYCSFCCGKPSAHLATKEVFDRRLAQLESELRAKGVTRAYTACPNCTVMLRDHTGLEVIPVWPLLAAHLPESIPQADGSALALHDPCPLRYDDATHAAVRDILTACGHTVAEFPHNRRQTRCCGNPNMLMQTDPPRGRALRDKRLAEAPPLPVVSYCQACLRSFRRHAPGTRHLLELVYGASRGGKWRNRIRNVRRHRFK